MTEPIVLTALSRIPIPFEDDEGATWTLIPNMKAIEAVRMITDPDLAMRARDGGQTELEWFAVVVSRAMRKHHPEMTPEKVLEHFAAVHLIEIVLGFLTRLSQHISSSLLEVREQTARLEAATRTVMTSTGASS